MKDLALSPMSRLIRIGIGLVEIILIVGMIWFVSMPLFSAWDFRHGLWSPSYLLVRDANPYGIGAPSQTVRSVWLPMAIGAFFPLGWLNQFEATNVWLIITLVALGTTVWIAGGLRRPAPIILGFSASVALLFPAVLSHLLLGQFTILAGTFYLLVSFMVQRSCVLPSALLTTLALTKPQLGVLALPGIVIGFYRAGGIQSVIRFFFAFVGSLAWWLLPVGFINLHWLSDVIDILNGTPDWVQPSLFKIWQHGFGMTGVGLWLLVASSLFIVNIWLWLKFSPRTAMIWSLALTTLASPYLWSWDYVILVPAMVYSFTGFRTWLAKFILASAYGVCWVAMIWIRLNTDNSDDRFWWVPLFLLAALLISNTINSMKHVPNNVKI